MELTLLTFCQVFFMYTYVFLLPENNQIARNMYCILNSEESYFFDCSFHYILQSRKALLSYGRKYKLYLRVYRQTGPGPTQSLIKWGPGFFPAVKAAGACC
jgi:hypothetical protein